MANKVSEMQTTAQFCDTTRLSKSLGSGYSEKATCALQEDVWKKTI